MKRLEPSDIEQELSRRKENIIRRLEFWDKKVSRELVEFAVRMEVQVMLRTDEFNENRLNFHLDTHDPNFYQKQAIIDLIDEIEILMRL